MQQQEMPNFQEQLDKEMGDYAMENRFPSDELPNEFQEWVRRAFARISPSALNLGTDEFMRIYRETGNDYSLLEMGNIIRVLQSATMYAMDMEGFDVHYEMMQKMVEILTIKHRDIVKPFADALMRKYLTMQQAVAENQGKSIPLAPHGEA